MEHEGRAPLTSLILASTTDTIRPEIPFFQGNVNINPTKIRRFYEPIVLLQALNEANKNKTIKKADEVARTSDLDSEELFRNFVSKLAQICDWRPKGFTVTAFVVLQYPDRIQYVFGSNQRKPAELEAVQGYITSILRWLREKSSEDDNERETALAQLLRDILIFNRERIRVYLKGLIAALESCIAICQNGAR